MKALTICQPYAELIARGEKRVENRLWPTRYRGRLAIHAGASRAWLYRAAVAGDWVGASCGLAFGAVVAVCRLIGCVHVDGRIPRELAWVKEDRHTCGPWVWVLADVRRLTEPIPARGELGIWEWSGDVRPARKAAGSGQGLLWEGGG